MLAANQFRMTQTRDKLARDRVNDQQTAIRTHESVGREVREAIKRIGGVMPEQIPPAEHIDEVEKRIKSTPPLLEGRQGAGWAGRGWLDLELSIVSPVFPRWSLDI